jgi:hypothetical protein
MCSTSLSLRTKVLQFAFTIIHFLTKRFRNEFSKTRMLSSPCPSLFHVYIRLKPWKAEYFDSMFLQTLIATYMSTHRYNQETNMPMFLFPLFIDTWTNIVDVNLKLFINVKHISLFELTWDKVHKVSWWIVVCNTRCASICLPEEKFLRFNNACLVLQAQYVKRGKLYCQREWRSWPKLHGL